MDRPTDKPSTRSSLPELKKSHNFDFVLVSVSYLVKELSVYAYQHSFNFVRIGRNEIKIFRRSVKPTKFGKELPLVEYFINHKTLTNVQNKRELCILKLKLNNQVNNWRIPSILCNNFYFFVK